MDKILTLITLFDLLGYFWSVAILFIYTLSGIWFIKLYNKIKKLRHAGGLVFIIFICFTMASAFLINLVFSLSDARLTIATVYVIAIIRPVIFLAGCALASLAHTGIYEFKNRKN